MGIRDKSLDGVEKAVMVHRWYSDAVTVQLLNLEQAVPAGVEQREHLHYNEFNNHLGASATAPCANTWPPHQSSPPPFASRLQRTPSRQTYQ